MRECNVATSDRNSTAESIIGCRVRTYLTQLLLSEQPVPARRQTSVMELLRSFLSCPKSERHRTSTISDKDDDRRVSDDWRSESPPARKRRRIDYQEPPHTRSSHERSAGYVRLRFTYSGSQRLQRILFCPSRPPTIVQKSMKVASDSANSVIICPSNGELEPQQPASGAEKYQCWLRSCGEVFQTTGGVVNHVQREHRASMKADIPAMAQAIAVFHSSM